MYLCALTGKHQSDSWHVSFLGPIVICLWQSTLTGSATLKMSSSLKDIDKQLKRPRGSLKRLDKEFENVTLFLSFLGVFY